MYFKYILLIIHLYFYSSTNLNAGLLLVSEYFNGTFTELKHSGDELNLVYVALNI